MFLLFFRIFRFLVTISSGQASGGRARVPKEISFGNQNKKKQTLNEYNCDCKTPHFKNCRYIVIDREPAKASKQVTKPYFVF